MTNEPARERDYSQEANELRVILKSGDYTGADLMRAWCFALDAAAEITRLRELLSHPKPDSDVVERATELLAQLEEIDGNKAGAFTLRHVGAVGTVFERKLRTATAALNASTPEIQEIEQLRAFKARVLAAVQFEEPEPTDDAAIYADIAAGLSLRKTAAKHGLSVGQVRGVAKRETLSRAALKQDASHE